MLGLPCPVCLQLCARMRVVCVWGYAHITARVEIGGQLSGVDASLPPWSSKNQTQTLGLGVKHLYPISHLVSSTFSPSMFAILGMQAAILNMLGKRSATEPHPRAV